MVAAMDTRGISVSLELVKVVPVSSETTQSGAGLVVNHIARKAYDMGADYMYRVNDDTEFHGRWPVIFVESLSSLALSHASSKSNVLMGVVGPQSSTAPAADILMTHHFFHRTHLEVFDMICYPLEVLDNEYLMSFWMSSVYGTDRTFKMINTRVSISSNLFDPSETSIFTTIARSQMRISHWLHSQSMSRGVYADVTEGKPLRGSKKCQQVDNFPQYPNLVMECAGGMMSERANYCAKTRKKYNVIPQKSKGSMSKAQLTTWKSNECGRMFQKWYEYETAAALKKTKGALKNRKKSVATSYQALPMPDCLSASSLSARSVNPLIAIMSGSTSRKEKRPSNATLSMFTVMLPSLMRSLDCGFRYVVVIGYDQGDPFYDSNEVRWYSIK